MSDELFEGAEINGKQFPFVRITIAEHAKIVKKFKPRFRDAISKVFFPENETVRTWKRVRSIAFVKTGLWKYLRIIPVEFRCSEISIKQVGEIQASFFSYVREAGKGSNELLAFVTPSKIESEPGK